MVEVSRCPRCGNVLSGDLGGRCPHCLLHAGTATFSAESSGPATIDYPSERENGRVQPAEGQDFGAYHLVRRLGEGGMGTVYEAVEKETGRRVALKILTHSLDTPTARQRFLREGRLAASVNHPHSVYVFGTEEIEGAPVITMELVQGGTLRDRVRLMGPLPIAEAVDATLQIIEGLEAAHAVGVLHRDIKPSNCFVDAGGQVKIGDFGLSISRLGRADMNLSTSGVFLGTPTFASPEQLRSDELDQRSDLYSVGVTLYYLLTGKVPFEAEQMTQLVAMVLEKPTPDVRAARPETRRELARVLHRCLEKDPSRRFRRYAELRTALLPFSSIVPAPATPTWRFGAGLIDGLILVGIPKAIGSLLALLGVPALPGFGGSPLWLEVVSGVGLWTFYYILPEGLLGHSIGKRLFGLRVVRLGTMEPPGLRRSAVRTLIYKGLPAMPLWLFSIAAQQYGPGLLFDSQGVFTWWVMALIIAASLSLFFSYVTWALLFVGMHPGNGYASVHDRLSGTRVIFRPSATTRPVATLACVAVDAIQPGVARVGFYHMLFHLGQNEAGDWHLGYDARLLRKVWIRLLPVGTPPVEAAARNQARPGRLRWLAGQRGVRENWDIFEAPSGDALWNLVVRAQAWDQVRYWLLDLSKELAAALKDGTLPAGLGLDRVWITAEGRARLLDFPAPGLAVGAPCLATHSGQAVAVCEFLHQVAAAGLLGRRLDFDQARQESFAMPLPLDARPILEGLIKVQRPEVIAAEIQQRLDKPTRVTRARRLSLITACVVIPLLVAGLAIGNLPAEYLDLLEQPDLPVLNAALLQHTNLFGWGEPASNEEKAALEVYITGHFGERIKDPTFWENAYASKKIVQRNLAEKIVARTPTPSPQDLDKAAKIAYPEGDPLEGGEGNIAKALLADTDLFAEVPSRLLVSAIVAIALGILLVLLVCFSSIVCALIFGGGLLWQLFSIAAVTRDGRPAVRWRLTWRQLIAWSPILFFAAYPFLPLDDFPGSNELWDAVILLILGLIATSTFLLERSLPDRLAGTWLVIR